MKIKNNIKESKTFIYIFRAIFDRLPAVRKKQFWHLIIYMVIAAMVATLAAGSIALFAAAFSSPDQILESKYIVLAQDHLPWNFLTTLKGMMITLSCLMVLLVGIKNILENLLYYCIARFGAAIEAYYGFVLFRGFIHMPYEWHLNRNSADIILALQWRSYIGHSFFNTALKTISDVLLVSFLMLAVFIASPAISLIVFVVSGIIAYLIYSKIHHLQVQEAEKCEQHDKSLNRLTTKGIHGIKDVKVSGRTSFLKEFTEDAYNLARVQGMRGFYGRLPIGLLETIGFGVLAGAIIFMLFFTQSSAMEVTAVISLLIVVAWRSLPAISRIMTGFISMRNIVPYIQSQLVYLEDIEESAVYPPETKNQEAGEVSFTREIELKDICFSYQSRKANVLKDISFSIPKGQTVGIVGYSGVGKSTLIDILIGLLMPSEGSILIDGQALNDRNRYAWMQQLSYVPQVPYICDGSIAENVAFGLQASEIDRDLVFECCGMAYMQDILESLPSGIDTLIGERGVRLSGGQRQRVAIARSLYTHPELMIFDEATSSLDDKSERAIQETINALKGHKTLIIVAHRLKTVEKCDRLIWLEDGTMKKMDVPENVLYEYEKSLR